MQNRNSSKIEMNQVTMKWKSHERQNVCNFATTNFMIIADRYFPITDEQCKSDKFHF